MSDACEAQTYVKLVSAEGHEFFLDKEIAMVRFRKASFVIYQFHPNIVC